MSRIVFVIALTMAVAGPAGAEPSKKVLVLPFEGELGEQAPGDGLEQLTAVVARSAGITGAEVSIGQASFSDTSALVGCGADTADCLSRIAKNLMVDQVVTGAVEAAEDGSAVTVRLQFFKDGEVRDQTLELAAPTFAAVLEGLARDVPDLFVSAAAPAPAPDPKPEPDPEPETRTAQSEQQTPPAVALNPARDPARDDRGFDTGNVGVLAWGVTGLGVAAAGAGGVFLFLARDRQKQVDDAATGTTADLERLEQLEDEGEQLTTLGNAMLIGGAAALVAGGVLIAIQGLSGDAGADQPEVSLSPALVPGGAGINLTIGGL